MGWGAASPSLRAKAAASRRGCKSRGPAPTRSSAAAAWRRAGSRRPRRRAPARGGRFGGRAPGREPSRRTDRREPRPRRAWARSLRRLGGARRNLVRAAVRPARRARGARAPRARRPTRARPGPRRGQARRRCSRTGPAAASVRTASPRSRACGRRCSPTPRGRSRCRSEGARVRGSSFLLPADRST